MRRFALIPAMAALCLAGCPAPGATSRGGGSFVSAVSPDGAAGPDGRIGVAAADGGAEGDAGGPAPADTKGTSSDETSETPVNIVGVPIAMTPGDLSCIDSSNQVSFKDLETAVTGRIDVEGRPETSIRVRLVGSYGGIQMRGAVSVHDTAFPDSDPWRIATGSNGCIMLKIYAPPGRVLRFLASVPCCQPDLGVGEATEAMAALKIGPGCAPKTAEMALTIPGETEAKSVSRCDGWTGEFGQPASQTESGVMEIRR
ncbi:MAG TPA: hypothetical protein VLJ37_08485 [bacterium]|nr:hypothetical protein [bacterium]